MPRHAETPTLDEYLAAQIEWAEYSERFWTHYAEHKVSVNNRLAKRAGALGESLKSRSDWPQLREVLLAHDHPSVRMIAAHDLYDEDPERALAIWAEIEHGPYGRLSSDAHWAAWGRTSQPPSPKPSPVVEEELPNHPTTFDPHRERIAEAVLTVHGAIMNGGFLTAFAVAGEQIPDAIRGYENIGLEQVADLFRTGISLFPGAVLPSDATERQRMVDSVIDAGALEALDAPYDVLVPSDDFLEERLDGYLDA